MPHSPLPVALPLSQASQSIVVSGESGAGKTEVNKQCMNYLVWRACNVDSDLANRILESNPVLEGLGNAKTVRNNNSSRFGKFVTMKFDEQNKLRGAEMQTFLLEKSRVVATTASGVWVGRAPPDSALRLKRLQRARSSHGSRPPYTDPAPPTDPARAAAASAPCRTPPPSR